MLTEREDIPHVRDERTPPPPLPHPDRGNGRHRRGADRRPLPAHPSPAAADAEDVTAVYTWTPAGEDGYSGQLTIDNASAAELSEWTVEIALPDGAEIADLWNASVRRSGDSYLLTPPSWGAAVPAGGTYQIGFSGTRSSADAATAPVSCTVNGSPCAGAAAGDTEAPAAPADPAAAEAGSGSAALSWTAPPTTPGWPATRCCTAGSRCAP
ncbi:cellulose binding domain-containing protein [Nocardiopsis composta]